LTIRNIPAIFMVDNINTVGKDMEEHNLSESEQMYILSVVLLEEAGHQAPVSLGLVSDFLGVATVSTNQMVHKLADQGYLEYLPYQGLRLTEHGKQLANHVLHHRRLWQVFFESKLGLDTKTADEIACRLEHIVPCEAVSQLDDYLGHPNFTSEGLAVPDCDRVVVENETISLNQAEIGQPYRIERLTAPFSVDRFLRAEGFVPGQIFHKEASGKHGMMLTLSDNRSIHITSNFAEYIRVIPVLEAQPD
jgi:DtxR family Mn-dependent transcriptional regulator